MVNSADGIAWFFGETFFDATTIMPVYLSLFTSSPIIIGLVPAIRNAGWFLPQLFLSSHVEKLDRKLGLVARLGVLERLPYIVFAFTALWLPNVDPNLAVIIIVFLLVWKGVSSGLVALPWQVMIAKVIPVSHRGRFFGIANFMGSIMALVGAGIASVVLSKISYPGNYSIIFFLGAIGVFVSYRFLLLTDEPEIKNEQVVSQDEQSIWRTTVEVFAKDKNFGMYLFARTFNYIGIMAHGFIAIYAIWQFNLNPAYSAVFTAILFGTSILGYPFWGIVGDKIGHKQVILFSGFIWVIALILLIVAPSVLIINISFALLGFSRTGNELGDLNIAMEFGEEEQRATYIGIARTLTGPAMLIAPLIGGGIIQWFGYQAVFIVSLVFSIISQFLLWGWVTEPRIKSQNENIQPEV